MDELRIVESREDVRFAIGSDWDPELECYRLVYPAVRYGEPENTAQTPVVAVEVLRVIVERQRAVVLEAVSSGDDDVDRLDWVGDRVRIQRPGPDERARWLVPDGEGNYDLQPMWWMWELVDPDEGVGPSTIVV